MTISEAGDKQRETFREKQKEREKDKETDKIGGTKIRSDDQNMIVIHVCDEGRRLTHDFRSHSPPSPTRFTHKGSTFLFGCFRSQLALQLLSHGSCLGCVFLLANRRGSICYEYLLSDDVIRIDRIWMAL